MGYRDPEPGRPRAVRVRYLTRHFGPVCAFVAHRWRSAWARRWVRLGALGLLLVLLLPTVGMVWHVYFDERELPDIESFIRFDLPTTGNVYDARGKVLVALAREYREVVSYDEVPDILRQAILAAEDKNFFSHHGVDHSVLPRVVWKTLRSTATWWKGEEGLRLRLPQGGSTPSGE